MSGVKPIINRAGAKPSPKSEKERIEEQVKTIKIKGQATFDRATKFPDIRLLTSYKIYRLKGRLMYPFYMNIENVNKVMRLYFEHINHVNFKRNEENSRLEKLLIEFLEHFKSCYRRENLHFNTPDPFKSFINRIQVQNLPSDFKDDLIFALKVDQEPKSREDKEAERTMRAIRYCDELIEKKKAEMRSRFEKANTFKEMKFIFSYVYPVIEDGKVFAIPSKPDNTEEIRKVLLAFFKPRKDGSRKLRKDRDRLEEDLLYLLESFKRWYTGINRDPFIDIKQVIENQFDFHWSFKDDLMVALSMDMKPQSSNAYFRAIAATGETPIGMGDYNVFKDKDLNPAVYLPMGAVVTSAPTGDSGSSKPTVVPTAILVHSKENSQK
jgi:hypothetical protein